MRIIVHEISEMLFQHLTAWKPVYVVINIFTIWTNLLLRVLIRLLCKRLMLLNKWPDHDTSPCDLPLVQSDVSQCSKIFEYLTCPYSIGCSIDGISSLWCWVFLLVFVVSMSMSLFYWCWEVHLRGGKVYIYIWGNPANF